MTARRPAAGPVSAAGLPAREALARTLARHALGLGAEGLPAAVWAKAELCVLDALAAMLAARDLSWSRQAVAWVERLGARPEATVAGTAVRTAAAEAAFANAVMAHGLLREDMHTGAKSHIGAVVVPAALAAAEAGERSGAEFVAAVVAGYDVVGRVGRAVVSGPFARVFRPTGVLAPLGAAAAAARLMGLDEDGATRALGLAGNLGSGLNEWTYAEGTEVYFHAGFAARSGVAAAALAGLGVRASETIVEGRGGILAAFGGAERAATIAEGLGRRFEILAAYFKPVPACSFAQTACQAVLALVEEHRPRAAEVEAVRVRTFRNAIDNPGCDNPGPFADVTAARMSIQFCVAAVLARGALGEDTFGRLDDPQILRLARATELVEDAAMTAAFPPREGAEVEVRLKGGRSLSHRLAEMRPVDEEALRRRFREAAARAFGPGRGETIEAAVGALRTTASVAGLARLLAP
ncbi:MAG: MmgE/PrpD family protein [Proteobacteria bacterium]|nr:MmgE/PrpD family protein [Pseudomonadota bacterium]